MTEVSARRAATRERLIDAATTAFAEKGVVGASVEEICELAGFTRGAFYSNFDSKDALCAAVLEHQYQGNLTAMRDATASVGTPSGSGLDELIPRALKVFVDAQRADRTWVLASQELRLYAAREPALAAIYRDMHRRAVETVGDTLAEVVALHGCELSISAPEAISVLHAVHEYGAVGSLIGSDTIEGDVRVRLLAEVLRAMIRPKE